MIDARYAELIATGRDKECPGIWSNIKDHVTARVNYRATAYGVPVNQRDDVISEVLTGVYCGIGSYNPDRPGKHWVHQERHPRSFEFWINQIIDNQIRGAKRSDARWTRRRGVSIGTITTASDDSYEIDPESPADSPELQIIRRQYWQAALDRELSDRERTVTNLVFADGWSYAEAGEALGITANAVGCIVHDIRRRLAPALRGWLNA